MRICCSVMICAALLFCVSAAGQEESSIFNFLRLPLSSHAAALGGQSTGLADDDATLCCSNPSLMQNVASKSMALSFLSYMQGVRTGSAHWVQAHSDYGTWGVSARFASYGSIDGMDESGTGTGSFTPIDMSVGGGYSHVLSDRWSAGIMGHVLYSHYDIYSSVALSVDLGANYLDEERDFSLSLTANNIGVQVKRFNEVREHLSFNLQLGIAKGLGHAPVRIAVSVPDITRWRKSYYYSAKGEISASRMIFNHLIVGVDILPAKFMYISAGYNFRRASELKAAGHAKMAGLSAGAGFNVKKISFGVSWARYHVSASSLGFNVQYKL